MERLADFFDAAREEFDEAFDWYARRSPDAARGFAFAVDDALTQVLSTPERFPRTYADCQTARVRRYPYSLVFTRTERGVAVVAIAHAKRRPGYWRHRL